MPPSAGLRAFAGPSLFGSAPQQPLTPPKATRTPDPQQHAAIKHRGGPMRILAGAGSGKSTTLGFRVYDLLREGVPPDQIVVTTFTRKGSEDIARKLSELCGPLADDVTKATFHRLAATEMIAHQTAFGDKDTPRWHVLDDGDAEELWEQAASETAADLLPGMFNMPLFTGKRPAGGKEDPAREIEKRVKALYGALREIHSFQVNMNCADQSFGAFAEQRLAPRSGAYRFLRDHRAKPNLGRYFELVLQRYERLKLIHNAKDYDDLLVAWRDLLRTDPAYRSRILSRYQHVIVDEYQDTNFLQEEIISLLNTKNLTVVGDIAQCIYAWRSAVPALMITFHQRYPGGADFQLEHNYRSRAEILDAANDILQLHHAMLEKSQSMQSMPLLQLRPTRSTGGRVAYIAAGDAFDETSQVARRIETLLRTGTKPADIAVLARVSYHTRPLEARLRGVRLGNEPLPVQVWGGQSLLDSKTAKEVLSLFKIAARPGDPWPFQRIACLFPGVGESAAAAAFFRWIFNRPPIAVLRPLHNAAEALIAEIARTDIPASEKLQRAVTIAYEFFEEAYSHEPDEIEKRRRLGELEALTDGMKEALRGEDGSGSPITTLADLVNQYSLDPKRDRVIPDALTISTVHQAKGLEWKHVFVMGASDGTLPLIRKPKKDDADAADAGPAIADIEEECRILYVAMTRAKDELTISFLASQPSRFLMETPNVGVATAEAIAAATTSSDNARWRR